MEVSSFLKSVLRTKGAMNSAGFTMISKSVKSLIYYFVSLYIKFKSILVGVFLYIFTVVAQYVIFNLFAKCKMQ